MNTRPILDSDRGPFVLSASFNDDCSFYSVALESGFRVYSSTTCDEKIAHDVGGGIGCAELLGRHSYIALVGGGRQPKYPQNKVLLPQPACRQSVLTSTRSKYGTTRQIASPRRSSSRYVNPRGYPGGCFLSKLYPNRALFTPPTPHALEHTLTSYVCRHPYSACACQKPT
jgi:hypothetical protein